MSAPPAPPAPRRRVLIVDDCPDAADALAALLGLFGHECETATEGRAALAKARATRFDLAIVDIELPDLSGHELARELRRLPGGAAMHLVAISGHGHPDDRRRSLAAGFDQHLTKPIDGAMARRLVEDAGAGPTSARASARR